MCAGAAPDKTADRVCRQFPAGRRDRLIQNRKRIAHRSVSGLGKQCECVFIGFDLFAANEIAQLTDNVIEFNRPETEVLAARANGLRNIFRLGRCQHENDVVRRLFQRLQQRIEGGIGDLVSFVENVNLEAIAGRAIARCLPQFANFVDAAVGGGVDFNDVDRIPRPNFRARFAHAAGLGHRMILRTAVQRHREDSRDGGLPNAAMAAKYVAMGRASLLDSVLQRTGHVLLSDDLGEFLGTVFARQDGVTHEGEDTIIRDNEPIQEARQPTFFGPDG